MNRLWSPEDDEDLAQEVLDDLIAAFGPLNDEGDYDRILGEVRHDSMAGRPLCERIRPKDHDLWIDVEPATPGEVEERKPATVTVLPMPVPPVRRRPRAA